MSFKKAQEYMFTLVHQTFTKHLPRARSYGQTYFNKKWLKYKDLSF